jgi:UDP-glucose 4-epimerase
LFNLAAQVSHVGSVQNPLHDLEVNAVSQLSILEICRQTNPGIHIVYAGTRQIYGHPQYLPVDEKHPVEPADYNGVSKLAAEQYHTVTHRIYGLWTTSLRLTNTYGPRMRVRDAYKTFLGDWLRRAIRGEEIQIYGSGQQIRDFNFVDDVVEALLLCAANPAAAGQTFNLGGDEPVSLLALARLLIEVNGSGTYRLTSFPADRERIDIGDYYGDYTKIRTQLGWQPKIKLREGLTHTLEYYRQNGEHYW